MEILERLYALYESGQYDEGFALCDDVLSQNPDHAGLLATMGTFCVKTGKHGLAISLLHRAAEKIPQSDIYCNLAIAYKYSGQHEKSLKYFGEAVKREPTADTLAQYSAMFVNVGEPEKARENARRAIALNEQCSIAHWNLAMALLEMGEWDKAWDEHEWGFVCKMRADRDVAKVPYWDGTKGKRLLVYGEQGLGDEIMFASILPEVMKENEVVFECHQRLKTLFEKSFPGLTCYGTREDKQVDWTGNHEFDYRVSIGSLGKWYRRSKASFPGTPYLKADSVPRGDKFRVGISWTGGFKPGRIKTRSIPLASWKSILNNDAEFVSLQYTDCEAEIAVAESSGYSIRQYDEIKAHDYYETARIVQSCDLVISCCTSAIHLAGALGVPCWVMVPNKPAWRYGVKGAIPWYRAVRLYRQPKGEESWADVVSTVGYDLEQLIGQDKRYAYG